MEAPVDDPGYLNGIGDALSALAGRVIRYTRPNQSVSGRAFEDYLFDKRGWPRRWINRPFRWFRGERDHCRQAWLRDWQRYRAEDNWRTLIAVTYEDKIDDAE